MSPSSPPQPTPPDYGGGSLVNLVAELELRLTGAASSPRLHAHLGDLIPAADTYVLVIFDGLGAAQLRHSACADMAERSLAVIDAPFPTTTPVSLASIATGLPPSQHGLLGYQLWLPELGLVANTIRWITLWGEPLDYETGGLLPAPNLWERLSASGTEPITVQPADFEATSLTRALYRGCRFEPVSNIDEWVNATAQLAARGGRLILAYLPNVDYAGHVHGLSAPAFDAATRTVANAWQRLVDQLPVNAVMITTADHGLVDLPLDRQHRIDRAAHASRTFYGDGRVMFVKGQQLDDVPATWLPLSAMEHWWGPQPRHPAFEERAPDGVLVADDGRLLLHKHSDDRMVANHGGLTDDERQVPLIVAG